MVNPDLTLLLDMLSYCRPAESRSVDDFIARFIAPLGAEPDTYGNWHVVIPARDGSVSRVVWSCHTDTVHHMAGRQTVHYAASTGRITLSKRSKYNDRRNCLGADDTAGVYLCVQMIRAGVPGHYIFHDSEECGGIGSSSIAHYAPELLRDCEIAIALDRRGLGDVITHQYGRRCASDMFALSLAMELNKIDPTFQYDLSHGVYTDTAEYADLVAECCNLSVGYSREHSPNESLETWHLFRLQDALIALDTDTLFVDRVAEPEATWNDYTYAAPRFLDWGPDDQNDRPVYVDDDVTLPCDTYLDRVYWDVQQALRRGKH